MTATSTWMLAGVIDTSTQDADMWWKKLKALLVSSEQENPMSSITPREYPLTSGAKPEGSSEFFEPALKHYPNAYRFGDPLFFTEQDQTHWQQARLKVIDHLLRLIAESTWKDHLVLRGSVTLKTWLGEAARTPGDIDWVVLPPEVSPEDAFARQLIQGLRQLVEVAPVIAEAPQIHLQPTNSTTDRIWTYERAEGVRLSIPWSTQGLPPGRIQLDFVFCEPLPEPPQPLTISLSGGAPASLLAASPELSLAWKILWLETDSYPQGKDLYDATLLAERYPLPRELLRKVLPNDRWTRTPETLDPRTWTVDWSNFLCESPSMDHEPTAWLERLALAIGAPATPPA